MDRHPDGTGARKLPHVPRTLEDNPDWFPNGTRIAFDRCKTNCEVWTTRADGTHGTRLGPDCLDRPDTSCEDRTVPAWSPNGKQLAFGWGSKAVKNGVHESTEIYVANTNGTGLRQVTHMTADTRYSMDVNKPACDEPRDDDCEKGGQKDSFHDATSLDERAFDL
jgi:Tol biopolymer transport system component